MLGTQKSNFTWLTIIALCLWIYNLSLNFFLLFIFSSSPSWFFVVICGNLIQDFEYAKYMLCYWDTPQTLSLDFSLRETIELISIELIFCSILPHFMLFKLLINEYLRNTLSPDTKYLFSVPLIYLFNTHQLFSNSLQFWG